MNTLLKQEHPAIARYRSMKDGFDLAPIIAFALRDGYLPDAVTASHAFDGLLQWMAGHAVEEHPTHPYVMMNGQVDQAFHAFLLNTRSYLHFCRDYVGFFIHHTPIVDATMKRYNISLGIDYTVGYLTAAYSDRLVPPLRDWADLYRRGDLTASSVSCVSNGPDRVAHDMIGVADFRSFWDTNPPSPVGIA